MFQPWDFTEKPKPSEDIVQDALARLQQAWPKVAGPDLAKVTHPIKFTGAKRRRLLVHADKKMIPPWGDWDRLAGDTSRSFTKLRQSVNEVIAPLVVDHIDFDTSNL